MRKFFAGVLTTLLVIGLIGTAAATIASKTMQVDYNDIKVTLDGKAVNLVDANGSPVEPFAINGTTYLPVRAVSSALGLDVDWNQDTKTVVLTKPVDEKKQPEPEQNTTDKTTPAEPEEETVPEESDELEFESKQILSRNKLKIDFLSAGYVESTGGYAIKLNIDNDSDKDYRIKVIDLAVNGQRCDQYFICDISGVGEFKDQIFLYKSDLKKIGVNEITKIEFKFDVSHLKSRDHVFTSDLIRLEAK